MFNDLVLNLFLRTTDGKSAIAEKKVHGLRALPTK